MDWQVVVGNSERLVVECETYDDALTARDEQFTYEEREELGAEILYKWGLDY